MVGFYSRMLSSRAPQSRGDTLLFVMTEIQPADYPDALASAINSWLYFLTYALPALIFLYPGVVRWRYTVWLAPFAFIASCFGYFVYWRSIDYELIDYYHKTGYYNVADTWYVFMPVFRGTPNVLLATATTTLGGWALSRRPTPLPRTDAPAINCGDSPTDVRIDNPYAPPKTTVGR